MKTLLTFAEKPQPEKAEDEDQEPAEADGQERGRGSNDPAPKTLGKKKPVIQKPEKSTQNKNKRKNKGTPAKVEAEELKPAKAEKEGIRNASSSSAAQKPEEGQKSQRRRMWKCLSLNKAKTEKAGEMGMRRWRKANQTK